MKPVNEVARMPRFWLALVVVGLVGCPKPAPPPVAPPTVHPVRLLVVDDEPLAAAIRRQWQTRDPQAAEVVTIAADELARRKRLDADAVIYPTVWLGEFAERRWIVPLSTDALNDREYARRDVFPLLRGPDVAWGGQTFAVPFGSPVFLLCYRPDVFEHLGLAPPTTWEDYAALVPRLADRAALGPLAPAADAPWYGTLEPLAAGWAGTTFLARSAAYARHRSQLSTWFDLRTGEPLVAGPPFVRALTELTETVRAASFPERTPAEAWRDLCAGHAAMALTWPMRGAASSVPVAVTELPGAREAFHHLDGRWEERAADEPIHVPLLGFAGRVGSVTREARDAKAALQMLLLLSGPSWSCDISPASAATAPFRASHLADSARWFESRLVAAAAETIQTTLSRPQHVASLRLPGQARYFAALDQAVRQSALEGLPAADALNVAVREWQAITASFDPAAQRQAIARSIGVE